MKIFAYGSQRNILIIAHRTGMRADTLSKLRRDSFKVGVLSDGRKFMEPIIITMKNLPATLDNVTKALFRQQVMCAIASFERQCKLLDLAPSCDKNLLFRTTRYTMPTLGMKGTGDDTYRGVYTWVSRIIPRPVTFKDIARRVVMMKLANDATIFHLGCASLTHPPRFGSWACDGCKKAM